MRSVSTKLSVNRRRQGFSSKIRPGITGRNIHKSMNVNAEAQIPRQPDEKSTTMWTQPSTEAQRRYFSKHAPKRRVYGIIMTVLQAGHSVLAFAAWMTIFAWAFSKVPTLQPAAPWLAGGILVVFHLLFRVTWDTYWYDKLDEDPNTDSSPFIPLGILVVLLFTEAYGARQFLVNQVERPVLASTTPIDSLHTVAVTAVNKEYEADKSEIKATYDEKLSAAAAPYNATIKALRRRRADSPADQRYIAGQIATNERKRDEAVAVVKQQRSDALEALLKKKDSAKTNEDERREGWHESAALQNKTATKEYQSEIANAGTYAWGISLIMLGLIAGLGYARVRINVKSGILPVRNYTVLDAHGSVLERLWTAFADAFNRRSLQLAVWVHQKLSPSQAITSFDGTVVARPGTYNTPEGFYNQMNAQKVEMEARQKVNHKIMERLKTDPDFDLTPEQYEAELEKARTMNGSYKDAPLPGK